MAHLRVSLRCYHCCCRCSSYAVPSVYIFFSTAISYIYLLTTIHDDPQRCVSSSVDLSVLLSRKKKPVSHPGAKKKHEWSFHPQPLQDFSPMTRLQGWKTCFSKKAQLDPTCILSQLYRLLDFMALPHIAGKNLSLFQVVSHSKMRLKRFLRIKTFLGVAGVS